MFLEYPNRNDQSRLYFTNDKNQFSFKNRKLMDGRMTQMSLKLILA